MSPHRVLCGITLALLPFIAAAQNYPTRPIRVILSVPAGATPDVTARVLTPGMAQLLGQIGTEIAEAARSIEQRLDQQQAPAVADAVERCLEGQRSTVGRSVVCALCRHRIHRW